MTEVEHVFLFFILLLFVCTKQDATPSFGKVFFRYLVCSVGGVKSCQSSTNQKDSRGGDVLDLMGSS